MNSILFYIACFLIYSIVGWIAETSYIMIRTNKFVDRGFLIGPYCPIYGFGSILMVFYLTQYKNNILTVFILGVVVCSILEYLTSYIMEILFKTRWWDYSNNKFNLNGRICGKNSILFGLGGIIVTYSLQPFFNIFLPLIPNNLFNIITIITFIIFISDLIFSLNVINHFKKTLTSIDLKKDSTQEFSKIVKERIKNNNKIFQQRLVDAFPDIDFQKLTNLKKEIKEEIKEFINK